MVMKGGKTMCFVQLYRFMTLYFLLRDLHHFGVNQSEVLFLTKDEVRIKERAIEISGTSFPIADISAYCLWLLTNSLNEAQEYLFITKLAKP
jgi:hypothetical protein